MLPTVAAFTDTYLPTVNGVTYTLRTWRDRWGRRGGRMPIVYPEADGYEADGHEHPVPSVGFPFYDGFHAALPRVPGDLPEAEVVHAHTPFMLGLSAVRLSRSAGCPLVASYHTPTAEYADYVARGALRVPVERAARTYERWYMNRADVVVAPSEPARHHLREIGIGSRVEVVPNGVDVDRFRPVDASAFRAAHDLEVGRPLVGYTGRHGFEKQLDLILEATDGMDVTVVFGGDGPARDDLEDRAAEADVDARFLGFLDRENLAAFYSALDAFAFPSPVETQGLVALEANACGTPVAAVDAGALSETVVDGETGYHAPPGDAAAFRAAVERVLAERERLREACLDRREQNSAEHAVDRLTEVYGALG